MKIAYFPNQTALQSEPVWQAFLNGCKKLGLVPVENTMDADCAVIWSVLWKGRLSLNKSVYDHYRLQGKPVFIIEVGALARGRTWKLAVNNITTEGTYPTNFIDINRPSKLGISLLPYREKTNEKILIALQHHQSLQWQGMPSTNQWVESTINEIRKVSNREIVIRPHPRSRVALTPGNKVTIDTPNKIPNTYDVYDIDFNFHCVINHSSGTGIQALISGTPVICSNRSLAYGMSTPVHLIESPRQPERHDWFVKICHTEWTVEEFDLGIPQKSLLSSLTL